MLNKLIKRDGRVVDFDESKITMAIKKAMIESSSLDEELLGDVTDYVMQDLEEEFGESNFYPTVETIQDIVESNLQNVSKSTYDHFREYRKHRTRVRVRNTELIKKISQISKTTERDNANVGNNFSSKLLQIASTANKFSNLLEMPEEMARAHEDGSIHIHDLDSYNLTVNCLTIEAGDILKKGFNTGYGTINPPKRIGSAAALACILLQSSQNDCFGGQSIEDFDNDMADFVEMSEEEIRNEILEMNEYLYGKELEDLVESKLERQVKEAMQTVVYNLNTMHSRAGSQVPFSSLNIGLPKNKYAEMVCRNFLEQFDKGLGKGEIAIFPNVVFRVKVGVNLNPEDPYYHLKQLACKVAANRMNPTFLNCDSSFNKPFYDKGIMPTAMGW